MVSVRKRQHEFLSTPSARRATARPGPSTARHRNFYPRPPRGGRRKRGSAAEEYSGFLSTPSARRATRAPQGTGEGRKHFYPRPPRGGRQKSAPLAVCASNFYPRPPRGGRLRILWDSFSDDEFLSTPSARRATDGQRRLSERAEFLSTPSARRATHGADLRAGQHRDFYPRPPRGGRPHRRQEWERYILFLSTPSARRATIFTRISASLSSDFYPRPPRGGRRSTL